MESKEINGAQTLEELLFKLDRHEKEQEMQMRNVKMITDKLDKLSLGINRLEAQKIAQARLTKKVENATKQFNRVVNAGEIPSYEVGLRKFFHGAKITGKVIETVATTANLMFDGVARALKEEKMDEGFTAKAKEAEEMNLINVLKPLNTIIESFATSNGAKKEKIKEEVETTS